MNLKLLLAYAETKVLWPNLLKLTAILLENTQILELNLTCLKFKSSKKMLG